MSLRCFILFLFPFCLCAQLDLEVRADAAILINADTGAVIYEKEPDKTLHPASTTKAATALYLLEKCNLDPEEIVTVTGTAVASISTRAREKSNFTVNPHWIEVGGTHMGLKKDEEISIDAMLNGLMIVSANDAANMLAERAAGAKNKFVQDMNEYLHSIGCNNTNFVSAHGHHHPDHVTTARDLATVAKVGLKNEAYRKIASTVQYKRPETNKQKPVTLVQTNMLLRKSSPYYYERAIGVKTGHGSQGNSLIAAAEWKGRTLIAVLLQSKRQQYNFEDAVKLFEAGFNQPKLSKTIVSKGPQRYTIKFKEGSKALSTYTDEEYKLEYYKGEDPQIQAYLTWAKNQSLPIRKGDLVGTIAIIASGDTLLAKVPLYAQNSVNHSLLLRAQKVLKGRGSLSEYLVSFLGVVLSASALILWTKRR